MPDRITVDVPAGALIDRRLLIRRGRHVGWWVEGRTRQGRRSMLTWWPTRGLASAVARWWAAVVRRVGGTITVDQPAAEARAHR